MDPAGPGALIRLFVYGSLRRGCRHHAELEGAELLGPSRTGPGYRLVRQGDYPALVRPAPPPGLAGEGLVMGEVFRMSPELLDRLDRFEGCPFLYRRVLVGLADGSEAFAYVIDPEQARALPEVPGGLWVER